MKILRTPDKSFDVITDFPYEPCYTNIKTKDGSELRIHHIDEGPKDGPILLAMHGQPVWCYLYSKMIPFLIDAGVRVIAPDLPGYGKSDKPASREDYSYQNQVDWMVEWLNANDFQNITILSNKENNIYNTSLLFYDEFGNKVENYSIDFNEYENKEENHEIFLLKGPNFDSYSDNKKYPDYDNKPTDFALNHLSSSKIIKTKNAFNINMN